MGSQSAHYLFGNAGCRGQCLPDEARTVGVGSKVLIKLVFANLFIRSAGVMTRDY